MLSRIGLILLLGGMSGCAAIVEGRYQTIKVHSEPSEAECVISREGLTLGTIPKTPGSIIVTKDFKDLDIACRKPGYQDSLHVNKSDVSGAAILTALLIGPAALQIDVDAGAIRKYNEEVVIPLVLPGESQLPIKILDARQGDGPMRPRAAFAAVAPPAPAGVVPKPKASTTSTTRRSSPVPALSAVPSEATPLSAAATLESDAPTSASPSRAIEVERPASSPSVAATPAPLLASSTASAVVASTDQPPLSTSTLLRLENLKEILDRKALTQDEYEQKRIALMNRK